MFGRLDRLDGGILVFRPSTTEVEGIDATIVSEVHIGTGDTAHDLLGTIHFEASAI